MSGRKVPVQNGSENDPVEEDPRERRLDENGDDRKSEALDDQSETASSDSDPDQPDGKLEDELEELRNKYLRLHADYDNYRKRVSKDLSNVRLNAQVDTVLPIIQIFDHFDMAVAATENADNMDAIKEGLKMILVEFGKALDELGLKKIDAIGRPFDPNLHEAVAEEPSEEEEGTVIKQWRCGYQMGDRLIRPANVVVSSGPSGKRG